MRRGRLTGVAAALGLAVGVAPASAQSRLVRIEPGATVSAPVRICGSPGVFSAEGDGDTDLDFWLYDAGGRLVHADLDRTDRTYAALTKQGAGCGDYRLKVRNKGRVFNRLTLTAPIAVSPGGKRL